MAFVVGGSRFSKGGVEQFVERLAEVWPDDCPVTLRVACTDSAVAKHPGGVLRGLWDWSRAIVRLCFRLGRAAPRRCLVLLQYGSALDLAYVIAARALGCRRIAVFTHCSMSWRHLRRPVYRWLIGHVLRLAAMVVVLSREQMEVFTHAGVGRLVEFPTLLGEFVEDYVRTPWPDREDGRLVFAGRICREKGVLDAVELARLLSAKTGQEWRLDCYGTIEPSMDDHLRNCEKSLAAARVHVIVHGYVETHKLRQVLAKAKYSVCLSRQDAFPLAVLEALAAGALPVVYELPGTAEIVAKWGGLIGSPGDLAFLASRILEYGRSPTSRGRSLDDIRATYGRAAVQAALRLRIHQLQQQ